MVYKNRRRPAAKGRKPARKDAKSLTKTQRKEVKQIVKTPSETKFHRETIWSNIKFNSLIGETYLGSTVNDFYRAMPTLQEGTGAGQRIGKKINPVSCTLHLRFNFREDDALTRDVTIMLYLLTPKAAPTYPDANGAPTYLQGLPIYKFLDTGVDGVSNTSFGGTWLNSILPVDKDSYVVHAVRRIPLRKPSGLRNNNGVIGAGDGQGMYSIDAQFVKDVKIRVPLPKTVSYELSTSTIPSNCGPVWAVGYFYNDMTTAPDTGLNGLCYVSADTHMYYKDA